MAGPSVLGVSFNRSSLLFKTATEILLSNSYFLFQSVDSNS